MPREPIKRAQADALDAMYHYFLASEGSGETHVLLAGARMRIAAKVYGRARDEIERAMRAEAPTLTARSRELAAMTTPVDEAKIEAARQAMARRAGDWADRKLAECIKAGELPLVDRGEPEGAA